MGYSTEVARRLITYGFARAKVAPDQYVAWSWKGYDFSILDSLTQKGYISGSPGPSRSS